MATLTLWVPGRPIPKPAPRARINRYKRGMPTPAFPQGAPFIEVTHGDNARTPKEKRYYGRNNYRDRLMTWMKHEARRQGWCIARAGVPVRMDVAIVLPRTATARVGDVFKPTRPDIDNFMKGIFDCATAVELFDDDGQVVAGQYVKVFAPRDDEALRYVGLYLSVEAPYNMPDFWSTDAGWRKAIDDARF